MGISKSSKYSRIRLRSFEHRSALRIMQVLLDQTLSVRVDARRRTSARLMGEADCNELIRSPAKRRAYETTCESYDCSYDDKPASPAETGLDLLATVGVTAVRCHGSTI
jgi:hypothetical protein